jgi:hypothetical protein
MYERLDWRESAYGFYRKLHHFFFFKATAHAEAFSYIRPCRLDHLASPFGGAVLPKDVTTGGIYRRNRWARSYKIIHRATTHMQERSLEDGFAIKLVIFVNKVQFINVNTFIWIDEWILMLRFVKICMFPRESKVVLNIAIRYHACMNIIIVWHYNQW